MPRIMPNGWAAALALAATAMVPLASCAKSATTPRDTVKTQEDAMKSGAGPMLDEIYASRKPVRFEQIDVGDVVARYFPAGTGKAQLLDAFGKSPTSKIVEDVPGKLVVRDNRGQAMLDPDARSIVMTFALDADDKAIRVEAVHIKNQ